VVTCITYQKTYYASCSAETACRKDPFANQSDSKKDRLTYEHLSCSRLQAFSRRYLPRLCASLILLCFQFLQNSNPMTSWVVDHPSPPSLALRPTENQCNDNQHRYKHNANLDDAALLEHNDVHPINRGYCGYRQKEHGNESKPLYRKVELRNGAGLIKVNHALEELNLSVTDASDTLELVYDVLNEGAFLDRDEPGRERG